MNNIKKLNINTLESHNYFSNNHHIEWLTRETVNNLSESIHAYRQVFTQYNESKKWILIVNPHESTVESLAPTTVHQHNILRVHTNHGKVNMANITKALLKGNCSAIVLCDLTFTENELIQIKSCASAGETKCILINNNERLH